MKQTEKILSELGLSLSEIGVYLATLNLGEASVNEIAHSARFPRTTVASILERLDSIGLVSVHTHAGKRIYWVENPKVLAENFKAKVLLAEHLNQKIQNEYSKLDKKPLVEVYDNEKSIINLINRTINALPKGSEILTYDTPLASNYIKVMSEELFEILTKQKVSKGIRTRSLIPFGQDVYVNRKIINPSIQVRTTPLGVEFETSTWMFNDSLVLFSGTHTLAVCVTNRSMKKGFESIFEYLWQRSTQLPSDLPKELGRRMI